MLQCVVPSLHLLRCLSYLHVGDSAQEFDLLTHNHVTETVCDKFCQQYCSKVLAAAFCQHCRLSVNTGLFVLGQMQVAGFLFLPDCLSAGLLAPSRCCATSCGILCDKLHVQWRRLPSTMRWSHMPECSYAQCIILCSNSQVAAVGTHLLTDVRRWFA